VNLKKLLDPKTYQDCRVTFPQRGNDVIDVVGLHGGPLRLRFERYLDDWAIRQRIVAFLDDEPQPNHAVVMSGQEAAPEFRTLFNALVKIAYEQSTGRSMDERYRRFEQLFAGLEKT
jgi:hypothetical protein